MSCIPTVLPPHPTLTRPATSAIQNLVGHRLYPDPMFSPPESFPSTSMVCRHGTPPADVARPLQENRRSKGPCSSGCIRLHAAPKTAPTQASGAGYGASLENMRAKRL